MKKQYISPSVIKYDIIESNIIMSSDPRISITNTDKASASEEVEGREDNSISNVWDSEW